MFEKQLSAVIQKLFRMSSEEYNTNIRIKLFCKDGIQNTLQNKYKRIVYILPSFLEKAVEEVSCS